MNAFRPRRAWPSVRRRTFQQGEAQAELRELPADIPRRSVDALTNTRGQPWRSGLRDSFADAAKRAGVDKHFHDLRRTAATRLYLAGFTLREIAEIMAKRTTWSGLSIGMSPRRPPARSHPPA